MGIGAMFIQGPDCCVCPPDRHIPDDRNSHVGMGFQTKWQYWHTDEKYWDDTNHLKNGKWLSLCLSFLFSPDDFIILFGEGSR